MCVVRTVGIWVRRSTGASRPVSAPAHSSPLHSHHEVGDPRRGWSHRRRAVHLRARRQGHGRPADAADRDPVLQETPRDRYARRHGVDDERHPLAVGHVLERDRLGLADCSRSPRRCSSSRGRSTSSPSTPTRLFAATAFGLQSQVIAGPLRSVADGLDGVFGASAGVFPNQSYHSTNYFVDLQVVPAGAVTAPTVTSTSPRTPATGAPRSARGHRDVLAPDGPVDDHGLELHAASSRREPGPGDRQLQRPTSTASLTPSSPARVRDDVRGAGSPAAARARDGMTLAAAVQWSFTTTVCRAAHGDADAARERSR